MKFPKAILVVFLFSSTVYSSEFLNEALESAKGFFKETYSQLKDLWNIHEKQRVIINANNPHKDETAVVKSVSGLPDYEKKYNSVRFSKAKQSLERFLKRELKNHEVPRIGIVYSGGGYRAMILSLGYSLGLERLGLFDAAQYMSMLSGSTWFGSKYIYAGTLDKLKSIDLSAIQAGQFDIVKMQDHAASNPFFFINNTAWPKFIFDQPLTLIDVYGALLSDVLYAPQGQPTKPRYLSEQKNALVNASKPYPIYTAIRVRTKHEYDWCEMTPDHFKFVEESLTIPIWALGRRFKDGKSLDFAPEQTMGYYAGIFGSAYTVNMRDIKRLMYEKIKKKAQEASGLEKVKLEVTLKLINVMTESETFGTLRALPAKLRNPWRDMTKDGLGYHKYLELVDAGIYFNLPFPPLMQKERNIDLIIAGDSSASAAARSQLDKFFDYAQKHYGVIYKRTDDGSIANLGVYKPDKKAPVIVYVNFVRDLKQYAQFANHPSFRSFMQANQLSAFNHEKCSYCSTLNFNYSVGNYNQLSGMGEFNMRANEVTFRKVIEEIVAGKK